ncbi:MULTISPECIES: hypothetical protein [unclassified Bradyrhizobium]|nr:MULTISPECIES: hypothetical protein [unclassified Bradyrhizobium]
MDMFQMTIATLGVAGTGVFETSYALVATVIVIILVVKGGVLTQKWM